MCDDGEDASVKTVVGVRGGVAVQQRLAETDIHVEEDKLQNERTRFRPEKSLEERQQADTE